MKAYATNRDMLIRQARRLKDFNLMVGDKVKTRNEESLKLEYYKVTGIYNHIFTVVNLETGLASSFPKCDALTGVVSRCL